ncbi:hypothetical protein RCS94_05175 [Orbaceae bacterium ac157xtp]
MFYLSPFGLFLITLYLFWYVYLAVVVVGIVLVCFCKPIVIKVIGWVLIAVPIACYALAFLVIYH